MTLIEVMTLVSVLTTWPTVFASVLVVVYWSPDSVKAIRTKRPAEFERHDWFIIGVAIGFLGGALDNVYWQLAWNAHFLESKYAEWLFDHGSFFNVFFRQGCGLLAALCHLTSYALHKPTRQNLIYFVIAWGWIAGFVNTSWLIGCRFEWW